MRVNTIVKGREPSDGPDGVCKDSSARVWVKTLQNGDNDLVIQWPRE